MLKRYGWGRGGSRAPRRDDIAGRGMTADEKRSLSGRATAICVVAKTNEKLVKVSRHCETPACV